MTVDVEENREQLPAEGRHGKGVGTSKEMTFTEALPVARSFAQGYKIILFQGNNLIMRKSPAGLGSQIF